MDEKAPEEIIFETLKVSDEDLELARLRRQMDRELKRQMSLPSNHHPRSPRKTR